MELPKFIKWLRPGLRIKRWIAVIILGMLFAVFASVMLYLFAISVKTMDGVGAELLAGAGLGFVLSGFCLITGIYRLIKSMWGLVDRRAAKKGLMNAAYERAVLAEGPKIVAIGGGTGLACVLTSNENSFKPVNTHANPVPPPIATIFGPSASTARS